MKYTYDYIVGIVGRQGYLDLAAVFLALGFENIQDVPDALWEVAIRAYEESFMKKVA
mgnify:CR=1 FL=1